jgi:hypothetical protein
MKKYGVLILSLMICGVVGTAQAGVPVFDAYESFDSPSEVVLPDCSTVDVSTSFHSVITGEPLDLDVNNFTQKKYADETPACDGTLCDDSLDDMDNMEIGTVYQRKDSGNATPAKNGKGTTGIACTDDCPDDTVEATVGTFSKKNAHFTMDLQDGDNGNAFVCKVGLNIHSGEDEDVL